MLLFYQIRLYSDAVEQVYYLAACVYGWWRWGRLPREHGRISQVTFSSGRGIILALAITSVLSVAAGLLMSRLHVLLPALFPEPASYPYVDALTTVMSFTAMLLMARQRIESWVYWIVVDVIGIWLYFVKDVRFVSLLYVILLILATKGLISWLRVSVREDPTETAS
jgi:nicotinamide mononucleotide transporter